MASSRSIIAGVSLGLLGVLVGVPVSAQDQGGFREPELQGPFRVEMDRVVDGWRYNLRWREGPQTRRDGRYHLSDVHTATSTSTSQDCEREAGLAVRDFVRDYVRGKRLRARNVRRGRDPRIWVGQLEVDGKDLSTTLLDKGLAMPYQDSRRNSQLRRWDCSLNDAVMESLPQADIGPSEPID